MLMETIRLINWAIALTFFLCYAYQFLYIPIPFLLKDKPHRVPKANRYAALICARNEKTVIADLIESLKNQTYPQSLLTVFVLADNCTDDTAAIARSCGAVVYERQNREQVGKGYALQALLAHIAEEFPGQFDGYFVFDADNILEPDYVEQMNKTFSDGNEIVTSYRNSKNYGDNWISAGYALWFLRESRFLNHARSLLSTSCAVSGTGFLFSQGVLEENGGWPFHLLTEDIEFSIAQILSGHRIAFCKDAELYDEQPTSFRQSWHQRMRWSRGYLQVFRDYGLSMLSGVLRGSFACYDMCMAIMPAFVLSTISIVLNLVIIVLGTMHGDSLMTAVISISQLLLNAYAMLFVLGAITTATEWKHIHTTTGRKIGYALTFPLFMFTYIPISLCAMVRRVEWKPIAHHVSADSLQKSKNAQNLPRYGA